MTGEQDLGTLLTTMAPELVPGALVVTRVAGPAVPAGLHPFATVQEAEGLTLVLAREEADAAASATTCSSPASRSGCTRTSPPSG